MLSQHTAPAPSCTQNAPKIADKAVTIMTKKLVTVDEVFARLDATKIAMQTREPLRRSLERVIESVAISHAHDGDKIHSRADQSPWAMGLDLACNTLTPVTGSELHARPIHQPTGMPVTVWESLPLLARSELVERAAELAEPYVAGLVGKLRQQIHELMDLHALATEKVKASLRTAAEAPRDDFPTRSSRVSRS